LTTSTNDEIGIAGLGQENYSSVGRCHVCFAVGKKTNQQLEIGILLKKKLEIVIKVVVFA
jgi:hypothetical protein